MRHAFIIFIQSQAAKNWAMRQGSERHLADDIEVHQVHDGSEGRQIRHRAAANEAVLAVEAAESVEAVQAVPFLGGSPGQSPNCSRA
jgi:hypothetical protein